VLGGEALGKDADRAKEEGAEDMEELLRSMAKRSRQAKLSFFAFTATPKHKTLVFFGRNGQAAHRYTMRQAIQEGFILDVLKSYTTYATYFKLLKAREDDTNVERKKAASALARFLRLHPHNIAQKTEVMVLPAANLLQPSPSPSPNFVASETMESAPDGANLPGTNCTILVLDICSIDTMSGPGHGDGKKRSCQQHSSPELCRMMRLRCAQIPRYVRHIILWWRRR
jgi:hypothetical protein